ncbi:MAG: type 4a pilus biogenesis protein PilO [Candidatus Margulisiibacteriota bacterium]|jgi:Tfp pilus assembly protein PilO
MKLNWSLKEKVIFGSVVGLIMVFVLAYALVFKPKMEKTKEIRNQIRSVNVEVGNIAKMIQSYRDDSTALDKEDTYFQEKFLTRSDQIPQILTVLGEVVGKSRAEIVSVRPQELKQEEYEGFKFQTMLITMELRGRYIPFMDCLRKLLDIPFLIDIRDIQFAKNDQGTVTMTLNLKTYFLVSS